MATKVDFRLDFNTALGPAIKGASEELLYEIGQHIVNEARPRSPYATGHNAGSIFVAKSDGVPRERGERKNPKAAWPRSVSDVVEKGKITVGTSSGYGGILELNLRGARFTRKGKVTKGANAAAGTRGANYIRRALARVTYDLGTESHNAKMVERAMQTIIETRAARTTLRRVS